MGGVAAGLVVCHHQQQVHRAVDAVRGDGMLLSAVRVERQGDVGAPLQLAPRLHDQPAPPLCSSVRR